MIWRRWVRERDRISPLLRAKLARSVVLTSIVVPPPPMPIAELQRMAEAEAEELRKIRLGRFRVWRVVFPRRNS